MITGKIMILYLFKDPEGNEKKITNIWDYLAYRNRKEDFSKVGEGARKKPKYYND